MQVYRIILICSLFITLMCCRQATHNVADPIVYDEWKLQTNDGTRLYVTEFGKGDTIIVIHGGFGAEHSYLLNAFEPLAGNYHFILYDQRGSLRSASADSIVTVANHIKDIAALQDELGQERVTIVAHSMGGYLAMRYAAEYPGRVKKLVLISSPPAKCNIDSLTTLIQEPTMKRWERPAVVAEFEKYGVTSARDSSYTDRQSSLRNRISFGAINLHDVTNWRDIRGGPLFFSASASSAASASMEQERWNYIAALKAQQIPVYIVHGDDDYLPYTYHNSWKDSLPDAHFHLIEGAGHCLWIDNFEAYNSIMQEVL